MMTQPRVTFAFLEKEWRIFFPEGRAAFPFDRTGMSCWAKDEDLCDPIRWERFLREWQPGMLVTCWSTPPLPPDWLAVILPR